MIDIEEYKHGKCELFAFVLHKMFGYPIRFYIDPEGDIELLDESVPVLIHACNILNENTLIDVDGKIDVENILNEFDYFYVDVVDVKSLESAKEVLKAICLPYRMGMDEERCITEHVRDNIEQKNLLTQKKKDFLVSVKKVLQLTIKYNINGN